MTIGLLFVFVAVVAIIIVLLWTFEPNLRAKMKGWTTIIELLGSGVYWLMDKLTGGIQDAVSAGYVPAWLVGYIPLIMIVWLIMKRFDTTTPVGVKPSPTVS